MVAIARIAPDLGSRTTAAPFLAPLLLCTRSAYAFSWALLRMVSWTLPPEVFAPVNIARSRSVNRESALPDRNESCARSMLVASPLTGLYPVIGAYASGSSGYVRRYLSWSLVGTLCAIGMPSCVEMVPRWRSYSVNWTRALWSSLRYASALYAWT